MIIIQNAAMPAGIRNAIVDVVALGVVDVRVASAYVTLSGSTILLNAVRDVIGSVAFAAIPKMLVTSFDFGLTEPQALRHWLGLSNGSVVVAGAARVAQGSLMPLRAFHPKLYAFGRDAQTCNALIGSPNLTGRGLSVNTEAAWVQHGIPRTEMDAAFLGTLYETSALTEDILVAYEALRQAQPPPP